MAQRVHRVLVILGLLFISACGGGGGGGGTVTPPSSSSSPAPGALNVSISGTIGAIGSTATISTTQSNYNGPFTYTSSNASVVSLSANGSTGGTISSSSAVTATVLAHGTVNITVAGANGQTAAPAQLTNLVTADPSLPMRGLHVQFEERGWATGYWNGQAIDQFNTFDSVVNSSVSTEIATQLDAMKSMGVNTITFELRAADNVTTSSSFTPPNCYITAPLGLQYPQPAPAELTNLKAFFDLVASKGMKIVLELVNTHMDEQPPSDNATWLDAILQVVKGHPALYLVNFDGSVHVDTSSGTPQCGIPAEAPLWLGYSAAPAQYVKWAIQNANSLGVPYSQLSAESIVGSYLDENSPNLSSPISVMKQIFDSIGVPENQRTYSLSFYEHNKCRYVPSGATCSDETPDVWADETMQYIWSAIGRHGARAVATEMGDDVPVSSSWPSPSAVDNLLTLFKKYGVDGGSYWVWANSQNSDDTDPTLSLPVKLRGATFTYTAVEPVIARYYTGP